MLNIGKNRLFRESCFRPSYVNFIFIADRDWMKKNTQEKRQEKKMKIQVRFWCGKAQFWSPFGLILASFWAPFGVIFRDVFLEPFLFTYFCSFLVYRAQMGTHFGSILAPFSLRFSMRFSHALWGAFCAPPGALVERK